MKEVAEKYYHSGLSVVPVGKDKLPTVKWKNRQTELVAPNGEFDTSFGIAIICGGVSGRLEIVDIDLKYDLSRTLWDKYKQLIKETDPTLLKRLLIEKSPSGGYHFIYRWMCNIPEGNKKLAQRFTTDAEKIDHPKEKIKVLIETRGEGGYFMCAPSPGYEVKQGSFDSIPELTVDERNVLINCATALDEVNEVFNPHIPKSRPQAEGVLPLTDYSEKEDSLDLLLSEGWSIGGENSLQYFLKRPGGTENKWSSSLFKDSKMFRVYSTSTEFDSDKNYSPASVYTILKHKGDYYEAAKELYKKGYGTRREIEQKEISKPPIVSVDDNDYSFLLPVEEIFSYVNDSYSGNLPYGLTTGIPSLDNNFRFKRAKFNIIGGQDNVGKTIVILYLLLRSAQLHNWKWLLVSVENGGGFLFKKLMEFHLSKPIKKMTELEMKQAAKFIKDHFFIVSNKKQYTYLDIIAMGKKMKAKEGIDGIMIDPYNAVEFDEKDLKSLGDHNYHYKVTSAFRNFTDNNDCCIYLNCHAVTDAIRRVWTKETAPEKDLAGHPMPPKKSDVEGGGKFANRADDFLIIHRYTQIEARFNVTEIHVTKVKETETGGRPTPRDKPIRLEMCDGGAGFVDVETRLNAITGAEEVKAEKKINRLTEPKPKEEDSELPF